jgi:Asp-tRNA(Asn)/Glu-tRNA(Gln) amidotransferase A subunit family amidase
LSLLARLPVPIVRTDFFASRLPEHALEHTSPLVEIFDPVAAIPGVLGGEGVIVKDQLDVAGMRTGVGLPDGGELAERDSAIVARIRAAGGTILGKAKMTELGMDGLGTMMPYAMPANPRAPGYSPGGSSTGTAVAAASGSPPRSAVWSASSRVARGYRVKGSAARSARSMQWVRSPALPPIACGCGR